jgi:hypothetical protein
MVLLGIHQGQLCPRIKAYVNPPQTTVTTLAK